LKEPGKDYPLPGVEISAVDHLAPLVSPVAGGDGWESGPNEFLYNAPGTGTFYARDGKSVLYRVDSGADPEWIRLILHSQVLAALLHQRGIINFHAGSFVHRGRRGHSGHGVMVLGATGAGKSSLVIAMAHRGATFLTDDFTPVVFRDGYPCIWPLRRKVKIRPDTASQLGIAPGDIHDAEAGTGKKYLNIEPAGEGSYPLDIILRLEIGEVDVPVFSEPSPSEAFALLRGEICSWEILAGMPDTEADYLQQLVKIIERVHFVRVTRPADCKIADLHTAVVRYIDGISGKR
jgi:hypothetical protein